MEEEMVEDTGNAEEVEYTFTAYEVDLDYEFDAARFFDFSRAESPIEASQAELWFDKAGSYPPSPFVARLVPREDILMENVNISPKSKGVESMNLSDSDSDVEVDNDISSVDLNYGDGQDKATCSFQQKFQNQSQKLPSGLTFYNPKVNNVPSENQAKRSMKNTFPRNSTLMKPTASQLAKQNNPFQINHNRSHTSVSDKTSKTTAGTCVVENQAAKRQKLDGGLLRKVAGAVQLQQTNFVHKAPKRDGYLDGNTNNTKLRITIPRDPDLETAHRAQRTRAKSSKDENAASTVRRFKALPLNKKILEAPSMLPKRSTRQLPDFQEFHLKTSERAMKHSSAVLRTTVPCHKEELQKNSTNLITECGNREHGPGSIMNTASTPDSRQSSWSFKALPLNKKILTSKGDIGIFRNSKKESTVPMEFNFQTDKRCHNNPPVELFNKLSLASDTPSMANSASNLPSSISVATKGSKENRWGFFQRGNEMQINQPAKIKPPLLGAKQQVGADEKKIEVNGSSSVFSWSKPIR